MDPIVADNILIDLRNASLEETRDRWNPAYLAFVKNGAAKNATFCLHLEIMKHCDEIVAIQLAEKNWGLTGLYITTISSEIFCAICISKWCIFLRQLLCKTHA